MNTPYLVDTSELTMSSREIAGLTNKRHSNVVRDIRKMLEELKLDALNFEHIYTDPQNRDKTEYLLPKNLTINLITGYRADIRLKIINRWIELETKPLSPAELLVAQAKQYLEHERRLKLVESRQKDVDQHLKQLNPDTGYRTILAHCKIHKFKLPMAERQRIGQRAKAICKSRNLRTGKIPDERHGSVNSYPIEILEEVMSTPIQYS